jgi:transposase
MYPYTNPKGVSMLMLDYTTELLDLEDVTITKAENISNQLHIYIELPRRSHVCPACGAVTDLVHDYRMQVIKDVPLARDTFLHLRKRRYRCSCGKRFFDTFLPRYHRVTSRLVAQIIQEFRKLVPTTEIGSRFNVSAVTAMRYFNCFNQRVTELPEVLSLDEFKGNSGGQKYNSIIVDPKNRKVLDILPNRFESELVKYFLRFPSRTKVKYFVCDMNPHFRNVAKTSDAYRLKNEFLAVIRSRSSAEGKQRLADWLFSVEVMDLPEFHDCTKAHHNWHQEILDSMDVPWTSGYIEGCNNKTKVLKRVCFGMRNFNNFRKRILFCNT